ncbi:MAG: GNAT family N-acetyltransferase [Gaiellaceae bacterium]
MRRPETRPFAEGDLDAAATLLAERHRRHRAAEPLLPARYEDPAAAREEVEALWHSQDASGAVALRDDAVVGFLLGVRKSDDAWGPNVWIDPAGHAASDAEDVRDLYGAASPRWVEEGRTRHYALVPANDEALVDAWFRLSFGMQHAHGIRELPAGSGFPAGTREAHAGDVDALVGLAPLISDHQSRAPVFGPGPRHPEDEIRTDIEEDLSAADVGNLVAELDGRIAGNLVVAPVETSSQHVSLARPEGASFLAWAATLPEARGSGAGVALTEASFAWVRGQGYETMVTDWRVTNLLSSRFWPRRGFRTSFLRLYRSIP